MKYFPSVHEVLVSMPSTGRNKEETEMGKIGREGEREKDRHCGIRARENLHPNHDRNIELPSSPGEKYRMGHWTVLKKQTNKNPKSPASWLRVQNSLCVCEMKAFV